MPADTKIDTKVADDAKAKASASEFATAQYHLEVFNEELARRYPPKTTASASNAAAEKSIPFTLVELYWFTEQLLDQYFVSKKLHAVKYPHSEQLYSGYANALQAVFVEFNVPNVEDWNYDLRMRHCNIIDILIKAKPLTDPVLKKFLSDFLSANWSYYVVRAGYAEEQLLLMVIGTIMTWDAQKSTQNLITLAAESADPQLVELAFCAYNRCIVKRGVPNRLQRFISDTECLMKAAGREGDLAIYASLFDAVNKNNFEANNSDQKELLRVFASIRVFALIEIELATTPFTLQEIVNFHKVIVQIAQLYLVINDGLQSCHKPWPIELPNNLMSDLNAIPTDSPHYHEAQSALVSFVKYSFLGETMPHVPCYLDISYNSEDQRAGRAFVDDLKQVREFKDIENAITRYCDARKAFGRWTRITRAIGPNTATTKSMRDRYLLPWMTTDAKADQSSVPAAVPVTRTQLSADVKKGPSSPAAISVAAEVIAKKTGSVVATPLPASSAQQPPATTDAKNPLPIEPLTTTIELQLLLPSSHKRLVTN